MAKFLSIITTPARVFSRLSRWMKVVSIVAVILAVVGIILYRNWSRKNRYNMEKVIKADVTEVVTETGTMMSGGQVDVYSPTNGTVEAVFVVNGNTVKKGDKLFSVTSAATKEEHDAAYSSYMTAQAALNSANATAFTLRSSMYTYWKTYLDLATNDTYESSDGIPDTTKREAAEFQTAQDDWLAAEKKYKDQQTAIVAAQAQVSSTWEQYKATQNADVIAPSDGTVANLSVAAGESVHANPAASSYNGSALGVVDGMPVLSLVTSKTMEFRVPFGQTDIAKIKPGQDVSIEPDAYPGKTYKGSVVRVDSIGRDIQSVVKYNVYVEISDGDGRLKAGMTGDATIVTTKLSNVLSVTNAAVKLYKGGKAVQVLKARKKEPQYIPVEIGVKGNQRTQILGGVAEGTEVITALTNEQIKRPGMLGF